AIRSHRRPANVNAIQQGAVVVRVETEHITTFGPSNEDALSVRQSLQNRRIADIHVWTHWIRTRFTLYWSAAATHEYVVLGCLIGPEKLSSVDVYCHDAVRSLRPSACCSVTRSEVDGLSPGIHSR